jgi:hypothetical protein
METTAVEWYFKQMQLKEQFTQEEFDTITNQAKEMEKQQIVDAYQQGFNTAYFRNPLSKEQYYKETFNK